ncbi:adenylosuccinate lyase [Flavivirga spongiicola]|uniref:Adenylosuccinate lyase n=1 Tax=Flavivirga spongiicola TaxID=421621 RepID=A0ABU7XPH3_9FLAO|nr:adenylosuccinate lyase [Flavivirga sp. MEBiC05379]MDO5977665.1 adenylosuccinate lyase [Flavivirga sp. MEBiC05379]
MSLEEFYKELSYINASRENRMKYANMVLNDMGLFPKLIDILFMVDDKVSSRAAWVFEFVCAKYIYAIVPYLETFTKNINKIHLDSSVRPVSKVCEFITKEYYSKNPNTIKNTLSPQHKERIIEACFDWMISDQKVAPKVYAMESLFLYGRDNDWIHPELTQILEQDFQKQSAAFKARAKRTLLKIKKSNARSLKKS